MKINKDNANLEKSETIAEIPLACSDEKSAVDRALAIKKPKKGWPKP